MYMYHCAKHHLYSSLAAKSLTVSCLLCDTGAESQVHYPNVDMGSQHKQSRCVVVSVMYVHVETTTIVTSCTIALFL